MITTAYLNAFAHINITVGQVDENGKILSVILKSDCGAYTGTVHTLVDEKGTTYRATSPKGEKIYVNGDYALSHVAWDIIDVMVG